VSIGAKVVRHGRYVVFQMAEGGRWKSHEPCAACPELSVNPTVSIVYPVLEFIWEMSA
jgi:hypothetical protein